MTNTRLFKVYAIQFRDRNYVISLLASFVLLLAGFVINALAGTFATSRASNHVADIILSNLPVINVDDFFVYGPIIFWAVLSVYCLLDPKKIPFWLKSTALFIVIRSVFMVMTHIGPFPDRINLDAFSLFSNINFYIFNSGADLFFSGHTGLPFLSALIFWDNFRLRLFCLFSAVFFGIIVLLGHLHYTIDVISAFFITYTIYHIAIRLFPVDLQRFNS